MQKPKINSLRWNLAIIIWSSYQLKWIFCSLLWRNRKWLLLFSLNKQLPQSGQTSYIVLVGSSWYPRILPVLLLSLLLISLEKKARNRRPFYYHEKKMQVIVIAILHFPTTSTVEFAFPHTDNGWTTPTSKLLLIPYLVLIILFDCHNVAPLLSS